MFAIEFDPSRDACVGFYGLDTDHDKARSYYEATVALCARLNLPLNTLGIGRAGPGSERYTSFRVGDRRLKREGLQSVTDLTLAVCRSRDWARLLDADLQCDWTARGWALLIVRSVLTNLNEPRFRDWLRESVVALRPEYGIGYYRPRRLASAMYVIGMGWELVGQPPEESPEEMRRCGEWWDHGMRKTIWRQGILRDVYPLHILTKPQLDRLVGTIPLHEWIRQVPARGSLTELVEGWWLWDVPNDSAAQVRQALDKAGVLFQPPPEEPDE
jgi:hypothetical protein